jgi:two-component system, sensor histidine kinase and response regulator
MEHTQLLRGKRIFIFEDNMENRIVMRMLLGYHGATVEFDIMARHAVSRVLAFGGTDLILMDLMLANASGYNVTKDLRSNPHLAHIPIVAVSASDPSQAIPLCRTHGFAGFIAKPINDELLPQQLLRILNHEAVWYAGGAGVI